MFSSTQPFFLSGCPYEMSHDSKSPQFHDGGVSNINAVPDAPQSDDSESDQGSLRHAWPFLSCHNNFPCEGMRRVRQDNDVAVLRPAGKVIVAFVPDAKTNAVTVAPARPRCSGDSLPDCELACARAAAIFQRFRDHVFHSFEPSTPFSQGQLTSSLRSWKVVDKTRAQQSMAFANDLESSAASMIHSSSTKVTSRTWCTSSHELSLVHW